LLWQHSARCSRCIQGLDVRVCSNLAIRGPSHWWHSVWRLLIRRQLDFGGRIKVVEKLLRCDEREMWLQRTTNAHAQARPDQLMTWLSWHAYLMKPDSDKPRLLGSHCVLFCEYFQGLDSVIGGLVVGKRELCFQRARDRVPRLSIAVGAGNICAGPSTCGDVDKGYAELNVNESTT
jgi:hypothetical protein